MNTADYDCDVVATMEDLGAGSEEIIHYARACLPQREISVLLRGLEQVLAARAAQAVAGDRDEGDDEASAAAGDADDFLAP